LLPQDDPDGAGRAAKLEDRRDDYRFVHDWPAGVATSSVLPKEQDYSSAYKLKTVPIYVEIGANMAAVAVEGRRDGGLLSKLKGVENALATVDVSNLARDFFEHSETAAATAQESFSPDAWKDYARIFATWATPDVVAKVDDDASQPDAIAWQRIAGVNPTVLARCTAIPDGFGVTEEHVRRAIGDSLEAALAEGRAFLADYRALEGVPCGITDGGRQKYLAAPMALYIAKGGQLRSVAVQCGSDPSRYPVRTPGDGWHWRMATQCVQVADANHHEGSAHLGRTHLVMEAVTVAMKRELAPNHPLAVLLEPHTETTLAIDHSAKTSLIARGGTVDTVFAAKIRSFGDFVQSQVSAWSIRDTDPRVQLARRGLDDTDVLPVHPYRDDVGPVWDAIHTHVGAYLRLYYPNDATVRADTEVQAFVHALSAHDGGRLHDVPAANGFDDLHGLVTSLVFTASAQHSAVNFPQFRFMSYAPNMAGALFAPPPDVDTANTEAAFLRMLPPGSITASGATMVFLLSHVRDTTLGAYGPKAFTDPRVAPLVARFQASLRNVEAGCQRRDATRWLTYPYLHPSQILQSISI
ncbi:MAG: hypothetical protein KC656_04725, partial [Myxococcales bacterium]|nr:hypothetical protein [Myxococcales bacterium]